MSILRMADRIDGWHMGFKAARFDFERGRKLGRREGFLRGFVTATVVCLIILIVVK